MKIEELYQHYKQVGLVATDTRNIEKNTIFFALKGPNFNGNAFAEKALEAGAAFSIVDEAIYATKPAILLVDNVLETLQKLANYHRRQLNIPIIGLTGSNGKTTTKELLHAVLSKKYKTVATVGNLNNHIGVPLTLLSMNAETEIGIVEMGANHQKEIEFLSQLCAPNFGYITNFGKAHLEGFGGIEGVVKGKSELYTYLKNEGGTAFVNPDDSLQLEKTKALDRIFFEKELILKKTTPFLTVAYRGSSIKSQLIGTYNFTNICAAITVGHHFGIAPTGIKEALESYVPSNNRSQIIQKGTHTIILDAYNANPTSMKAAIESFKN
ncbi:MAG: UDP-N-acetylmuramoyl-tripeptide--D-alanyl-D-alanine ligase [Polaribacter sp.]